MSIEKEFEFEKIFKIENPTVEETQHWAKDIAQIDIEHLRSCLVAGSELCDFCLSLSAYYEKNLAECRKLIEEGKGDPVINEKRLPLLEIGERTNNLSGYLVLLQMDAMMSLINMLEAKSDVERLLTCKHAYTIIHDAKIKGLFRVVSREMSELSVLFVKDYAGAKAALKDFFKRSEEEAEMVRDNVDAHKSSSFTEQIAAYKQCEYGKGVVSMFALMKIAWIIQETIGEVQENLRELEGQFYDLVRERNKRWKELKKQLEERSFTE